jgi:RNA chaperone Hfq
MNEAQESFIKIMIEKKVLVSIYLSSGLKLVGTIYKSDEGVLLIKNAKKETQMIYKHAISTIM